MVPLHSIAWTLFAFHHVLCLRGYNYHPGRRQARSGRYFCRLWRYGCACIKMNKPIITLRHYILPPLYHQCRCAQKEHPILLCFLMHRTSTLAEACSTPPLVIYIYITTIVQGMTKTTSSTLRQGAPRRRFKGPIGTSMMTTLVRY